MNCFLSFGTDSFACDRKELTTQRRKLSFEPESTGITFCPPHSQDSRSIFFHLWMTPNTQRSRRDQQLFADFPCSGVAGYFHWLASIQYPSIRPSFPFTTKRKREFRIFSPSFPLFEVSRYVDDPIRRSVDRISTESRPKMERNEK